MPITQSQLNHQVIGTKIQKTAPAINSALTIQARVIHALVLRELRSRYGNRHLGFMWALIEPAIFISVFVAGFQLLGSTSRAGLPAPLFFVAGFSPFFLFRDIFSQVKQSVKGHESLLMFPQVTRIDIIIAKLIVTALVSITVFIVLMIGIYCMGLHFKIDNPLGVIVGFSLLISLGLGLGLIIGAFSIRYEFVKSFSEPLLGRPLFVTSGLFFSASMLPPQARDIFLYNPLLHCIEYIRSSMFVSLESRFVDLQYVVIFAVCLISLGLMLMGFFERQRS